MLRITDLWDLANKDKQDGEIGVVKNYDAIKEALLEGIHYGDEEDDDHIEFFVELIGHHAGKKNFDRLMEINQIIKDNYPEIFIEVFKYTHDDLVEYWCFHNNEAELVPLIEEFIKHPVEGSDKYFDVVDRLFYCGYDDLVKRLISETIEPLWEAEEIADAGRRVLLTYQSHIDEGKIIPQIIANNKNQEALANYQNLLESYNQEADEKLFKVLTSSDDEFLAQTIEDIKQRNNTHTAFTLFQRYAIQKNIPYAFCANYSIDIVDYWLDNDENGYDYFDIRSKVFSTFIKDRPGFFDRDSGKSIVLLYLSIYIYDFLHEHQIISDSTYHDFQMVSANLRELHYDIDFSYLWRYDFVHNWDKPNSWTEEAWTKEQDFFRATLTLRKHRDTDEVERLLATTKAFLPPKAQRDLQKYALGERTSLIDFSQYNFGNSSTSKKTKPQLPSRTIKISEKKPKIGRNEKITVRYTDGKVVKDVKYKKVMKDIDSKKCVIL